MSIKFKKGDIIAWNSALPCKCTGLVLSVNLKFNEIYVLDLHQCYRHKFDEKFRTWEPETLVKING